MGAERARPRQIALDFSGTPAQLMTPEEIFHSSDECLLRRIGEDRRVEKKSAGIHPAQLAEYLSMWANSQPYGGIVVIGITKDREFEGCSRLSQRQINALEKAGVTHCADARTKWKRVEIRRDKDGCSDFLMLVWVHYNETRVVKVTSGHAFLRVGDVKKKLKADEIRYLQAEKGEVRFEQEPCNLPYPDAFDAQKIGEFVERVRIKKEWNATHTREKILELMHLGRRGDGRFIPNVALAVLFARDPRSTIPGCRIRFLRFSDDTERAGDSWNAVKDQYIDGTIADQIQKAAEAIKSQLRTFSRLGADGKFVTSPEYPEFAWHEAVVNACAHRCYGNGMTNMNIFVKMFDDRLEVESPGAFLPFVTPENIYETHNPRNPALMDALYFLDFVKAAAEGTKRIRHEMQEMGLPPPEFAQKRMDRATVRVVLRNNISQRKIWVEADVVEILGAQIAQGLSEIEKRFITFAAKNGQISVSDAERLAHVTWHTARKMLMGLVKRGVFEHQHRKDIPRDPKARFKLRGYSKD